MSLRAAGEPDRIAYTFLVDGETRDVSLTYREVDERARAIAAHLLALGLRGERVLLVYPQGLEFVTGFFGCLYAGVIAIPIPLPRPGQSLHRLQSIVADAEVDVALTDSATLLDIAQRSVDDADLARLRWVATDDIAIPSRDDAVEPRALSATSDGATLAYLQYTSGSTSTPKGVMISHANILHNATYMQHAWEVTRESVLVTWLPHFHDAGLVDGIILPLCVGYPAVLMPPASFVQRPIRWLQAITRHRATHTGAPNFAYDLCVRKVRPEQRAELDLSSLVRVYNAAEPVHATTLDRFAEHFESCGLRRNALYPCYGLAEATLLVSGGKIADPPVIRTVDAAELERDRVVRSSSRERGNVKAIVGCGKAILDERIKIVNPETALECAPGRVGEIWVASASVARGYWNRPEESARTFGARIADTGEGPFLRTGDLGFLDDGELFVTGRLKDLVIIDGRNQYPHDIELTVETAHPVLRPGASAAFSVDAGGREGLVIVVELQRERDGVNLDEVVRIICRRVAEEQEVDVHAIAFIETGTLQKTSSGKIQRQASKARFLAGELALVKEWRAPDRARPSAESAIGADQDREADRIRRWLVRYLAERLHLSERDIDVTRPLAEYGLSSRDAVGLSGEIEEWLGLELPATLVYEHPTIEAIVRRLAHAPLAARAHAAARGPRDASFEPIAIIGLGCRFPGAPDPRAFWRLLRDGQDAVAEVPPDRWDAHAYYHADPAAPGKMSTKWGGFLGAVDGFDARFFGISPREAARMDPQQRLLLEVAWEALDDAGQAAERLAGTRVGVFVGIATNDYGARQMSEDRAGDAYASVGSASSIAANRLSYVLDLRGPSLAVDTACSSSLVSVHLACQSLWNGESTMALAGGVNLILAPEVTVHLTKGGFMAPDGRCKAFDARANGYVRGEGAGVVVLKPLSRALADGDPIHAVIRATHVVQDGRSNGLTAPNREAQEALLREAYEIAGVDPARVDYIEAHGTGTLLGDPIEARALGAVLGAERQNARPCAIGSVKTNIGHLEAAAGIAGLIKVVLALEHREIPPSLHFEKPNPEIPFADLGLRVQDRLAPWPQAVSESGATEDVAGIAGVSSFGFGGTNAHVVVEGAPSRALARPASTGAHAAPDGARAHILPLSARSADALRELASAHRESAAGDFVDACFTAGARRTHHEHRLAIVARSAAEAHARLDSFLKGETTGGVHAGRSLSGRRQKLAFVFSGQGPRWFPGGRELLEAEPVFRESVLRTDDLVRRYAGWSLVEAWTNGQDAAARGDEPTFAQPALFALQVGLAALWRSWGIVPDAVVGHSLGEIAAAHVAGVLTLDDAVRLVVHRGRLLQSVKGKGRMVAVGLALDEAERFARPYADVVGIAAVNDPKTTVFSGETAAIEAIHAKLQQDNVFSSLLAVDCPFHSPAVEPVLAEFEAALAGLAPRRASVVMVSTVTVHAVAGPDLDPAHWVRNIREPVRFAAAIETLAADGCDAFLEIGPHPVVSTSIRHCFAGDTAPRTIVSSLKNGEPERDRLLGALAALYCAGRSPDWKALHAEERRTIPLPAYPWQRERFWLPTFERTPRRGSDGAHPLLGRHLHSARPSGERFWQTELDRSSLAFLEDHAVDGQVLFPGSAFLELAIAAATELWGERACTLENVEFARGLALGDSDRVTLQTVVLSDGAGTARFEIYSQRSNANAPSKADAPSEANAWTLHATGAILRANPEDALLHATNGSANGNGSNGKHAAGADEPQALADLRARISDEVSARDSYRRLLEGGVELGPAFQGLRRLWRKDGEALGEIQAPGSIESDLHRYTMHPALLSACLQPLWTALDTAAKAESNGTTYLLAGIDRVSFLAPAQARLWSHSRVTERTEHALLGDVRLGDDEGRPLVEALGVRLQAVPRVKRKAESRETQASDALYEIAWRPLECKLASASAAPELTAPARISLELESRFERPPMLDAATHVAPDGATRIALLEASLDALAGAHVAEALRELGWQPRPGERVSAAELGDKLSVVSRHRRLFARLLATLADDGFLRAVDTGWEVVRSFAPCDTGALCKDLLDLHPDGEPEISLVARCGAELAAVLRGRRDPLELFAHNGAADAFERLHRDSSLARASNALIAEALERAMASVPEERPVRILEIGAGSGGTTTTMLASVNGRALEYSFTDASPKSTARARARFANQARLSFGILDIERDPAPQGFAPGHYDIVIAAGVLHATADLRRALGHVQSMLAPEGVFALLERTRRRRWSDLVFGMSDAWWRFADSDLRPAHALLSAPEWESLLAKSGFTDVHAVRGGEPERSETLFLARSPAARSGVRAESRGRWLVLADSRGVASAFADSLASAGDVCVVATRGDAFRRIDETHFEIRAGIAEDLASVLQASAALPAGRWRGVVHMWGLGAPSLDDTTVADLESGVEQGCATVLSLVQALANFGWADLPRVWLVTEGTQCAAGAPVAPTAAQHCAPTVTQAPLWGLGRVIAQEEPDLWGGLIDLDPRAGAADAASCLLRHVQSRDGEDQVAFRDGRRYVARLTRRATRGAETAALPLRGDASYLITGGLGGLGLAIADWMTDRGARSIVLVARTELPPRERCDDAGIPKRASASIAAIRAIEAKGARVHVVSADVADERAMQDAWRGLAHLGLPPVRGVVHAAGISHTNALADLDRRTIDSVLRAKLLGGWVLHRVTQEAELDFFVLFSSAAGVLGILGQGQAAYAAGNTFLDSLAWARRARGLPASSVDWSYWAEIGAVAHSESVARFESRGLHGITPRAGLEVFGSLVAPAPGADVPAQLVFFPADWTEVARSFPSAGRTPMLSELIVERPDAARPAGLTRDLVRAAPDAEREPLLVAHLSPLAARVLGLSSVKLDADETLTSLGLDSLMAVELKNRIEADFGVAVPVIRLLQGISVTGIARHVLEALAAHTAHAHAPSAAPARAPVRAPKQETEATRADDLLERIDELSESEVDRLLREMLAEGNETR